MDLRVKPVAAVPDSACRAVNGLCVPAPAWRDYDLGCAPRPGAEEECWRPPPRGGPGDARNPQLVKLAVEAVVAV